ncbi:hypothetical protein H8959_010370, partial [Pygathrix nigripes]
THQDAACCVGCKNFSETRRRQSYSIATRGAQQQVRGRGERAGRGKGRGLPCQQRPGGRERRRAWPRCAGFGRRPGTYWFARNPTSATTSRATGILCRRTTITTGFAVLQDYNSQDRQGVGAAPSLRELCQGTLWLHTR